MSQDHEHVELRPAEPRVPDPRVSRHGMWATVAVCAALSNPLAGLAALPFAIIGAALIITMIIKSA